MNNKEFLQVHADCVVAMHAYVDEAEKSCEMLGKCTSDPLPFEERLELLLQETIEKDAHVTYLDAKRLLHSAALLGYGFSN